MFGEKSQINIFEMITVLTALLVAFGIFFQPFTYRTRWREAQILLLSRDLLLSFDRLNKIYEASFDTNFLFNFLESKFNISNKTLIAWKEIKGTIPETIVIACNCSREEIDKMNFWFNPLKLNNRTVHLIFLQSNLENIPIETDVLLIKGYKNLSNYKIKFQDYLKMGVGIVEMMNFGSSSEIDIVQREIFGLEWEANPSSTTFMSFSIPSTSKNLTYFPYKYFHKIPLPVNISYADSSRTFPGCQATVPNGTLFFNKINYNFWICNATHVIFDTNGDGSGDVYVKVRNVVTIGSQDFKLSYINGNESISLSFNSTYSFPYGVNLAKLKAIDGSKVFLKAFSGAEEYPAVILNYSRVAWMYDFGNNPSHEEKQLLASLLLWSSKKKYSTLKLPVKSGFSSSYLNVKNYDMFEVYEINLGLASPY